MCGIVGYVGAEDTIPYLLEGLADVEYRGYDSSGVAFVTGGRLLRFRSVGKLAELKRSLGGVSSKSLAGIGHTRWATHGGVTEQNAHPHVDCSGKIAIVHNGIIENHQELRQELRGSHHIDSDTDSELIAHLMEEGYAKSNDIMQAAREAAQRLSGSFAVAALHADHPESLVALRAESPLVYGVTDHSMLLSSDATSLLRHTANIFTLADHTITRLDLAGASSTSFDGTPRSPTPVAVTWARSDATKGSFDSFLAKEIHDEPQSVRDLLAPRLGSDGTLRIPELEGVLPEQLEYVYLVACGTPFYACSFGKLLIERVCRLACECDVASEFRYRQPLFPKGSIGIFVSQSGETADTAAALRQTKSQNIPTIALVNAPGTTIAREADAVFALRAGPEVAVPSTKAFVAEVLGIQLIAIYLAQLRATVKESGIQEMTTALQRAPEAIARILQHHDELLEMAARLNSARYGFVIGRGYDEPMARESALKLQEVAYVPAQPLPAGELKHGHISLVDDKTFAIAIATEKSRLSKVASNLEEIKARGGRTYCIVRNGGASEVSASCELAFELPPAPDFILPVLGAVCMQLLAYRIGTIRGCDVDRPRNLAKSVTVE